MKSIISIILSFIGIGLPIIFLNHIFKLNERDLFWPVSGGILFANIIGHFHRIIVNEFKEDN